MPNIKKKNGTEVDLTETAVNEIAKRKIKPQTSQLADSGENSRYLEHNLSIAYLEKIDPHDPAQVSERTIDYFMICKEHDMKPSVAGYALALGVNRQMLSSWMTGKYRQNAQCLEVIRQAYALLDAQMEDWMLNGKVNPVAGIFLAKNTLGYRDQSEVIVSPTNNTMDAEMLIQDAKLLPK